MFQHLNGYIVLAFAESYDPLWVAYVNDKKYSSNQLYTVVNGFTINDIGQLSVLVEYEPQNWFYVGVIISITVLIILVILLYNSNQIDKKLKSKKWKFLK